MPLITIHLVKGRRSPDALRTLLDAAHQAVLDAFGAPEQDRYQVVHEHASDHLVLLDTGLGFERTEDRVLVHVTTSPRTREQKMAFYERLAELLADRCGLDGNDLMVVISQNGEGDWSFAGGRAQFMNGEL